MQQIPKFYSNRIQKYNLRNTFSGKVLFFRLPKEFNLNKTIFNESQKFIVCDNKEDYKKQLNLNVNIYELDEFIPQPLSPNLINLKDEIKKNWYNQILDDSILFNNHSLAKVMKNTFYVKILEEPLNDYARLKSMIERLKPEVVVIFQNGQQEKILEEICLTKKIEFINLASRRKIDSLWISVWEKIYVFLYPLFAVFAGIIMIIMSIIDSFYFAHRDKIKIDKNCILLITIWAENFLKRIEPLISKLDRNQFYVLFMPSFFRQSDLYENYRQSLEKRGIKYYFIRYYLKDLIKTIPATFIIFLRIFVRLLHYKKISLKSDSNNINLPMVYIAHKILIFLSIELLCQGIAYLAVGQRLYKKFVPEKVIFNFLSSSNLEALNIEFRNKGVVTYHIQHALVAEIFSFITDVTKNLTWGLFDARLIKKFGNDEKVIPNCYPNINQIQSFLENQRNSKSINRERHPPSVLVLTSVPVLTAKEIKIYYRYGQAKYSKRFIENIAVALQNLRQIKIFIKMHPAEKIDLYSPILKKYHFNNACIIKTANLYKLFDQSDIIITSLSSVIIEALFFKKPILVFNLPIFDQMTVFGQIDPSRLFSNASELQQKISKILNSLPNPDLRPEEKLFHKYFGLNPVFNSPPEIILKD